MDRLNEDILERPHLVLYLTYVKVYDSRSNKIINGLCKLYSDIEDLNFEKLHENNGIYLKNILKNLQCMNVVEGTQIIDIFGLLNYTKIKNIINSGNDERYLTDNPIVMQKLLDEHIMYDCDIDKEYNNAIYKD